MNEFDLYEIKSWGFPDWMDGSGFPVSTNLFVDLSHNPHFMAANILYANFNVLENNFVSWFRMNEKTLFLYEKLVAKYKNEIHYNHRSEIEYFHLTCGKINFEKLKLSASWKYRSAVSRMCQTRPLDEIAIPFEDFHWYCLLDNPNKCVIDFLECNPENIIWSRLSENSSDAAVEYLLKAKHKIDWWYASSNTNEKIMIHFNEHKSSLCEFRLSSNPTDMAVQFLLDSCNIVWKEFCKNPNDIAVSNIISIVSRNRDDKRIVWDSLCRNTNPRVMDILRNNKDKIVWAEFVKNPICFSYNYEMMRERCLPIKTELEDIFLAPENVMAAIENERCIIDGEAENDFEVIARLNC